MKLLLLYVLVYVIIGFGFACFDTDSKTICGCSTHEFMNANGKQMFCGPTKGYHDIFMKANLPKEVISIKLVRNEITSIPVDFFPSQKSKSFLNILELLLGENKIEYVEARAFQYFENLKSLNLSYNRIGRLHQGMFIGLGHLKRLYLEHNTFPIIAGDVFANLTRVKKLFVESDFLICNCLMKDFLTWCRQHPKVRVSGTCKLPIEKRDQSLRSNKLKDLNCDNPTTLPLFEIEPRRNQLVFTGDRTRLSCEGTDLIQSQVSWELNGNFIDSTRDETISESSFLHSNQTTIESYIDLTLSSRWSGDWKCTIFSNYSQHSEKVRLFVLEKDTGYCDRELVKNDFGDFRWPEVVEGVEIFLDCGVGPEGSEMVNPQATRTCLGVRMWSEGNYTNCKYVDPVARTLVNVVNEEFNQSAISTCNNTAHGLLKLEITAPIGFDFLAKFMTKCAEHLHQSNLVGSALIRLSSHAMDFSSDLIMMSQSLTNISDVINDVVGAVLRTNLDHNASFFNQNTANIALYAYDTVKSDGLKCNVSIDESQIGLHCHGEKPSKKLVHPGVYLSFTVDKPQKIAVVIYRNGRLFQSVHHTSTIELLEYQKLPVNITKSFPINKSEAIQTPIEESEQRPLVLVSSVYSVLPFDKMKLNSSTSITLIFRTDERVSFRQKLHFMVMWNGTKWQRIKDECETLDGAHSLRNLTVLQCKWFGIYAISKNLDENFLNFTPADSIFLMHPIVYVGATILSLCLCIVISTYLIFHNLLISRESRHMLVNVCLHVLLALLAYVIGVGRVDHQVLCYASGVTIHYSSLSILAWLLLTARVMGKEMMISQQPPPIEPKPKRPMLRFYLIACGIPVMICGITAAANNYLEEGSKCCWLSWYTSLYAFFVPAALTAVSCILFLLRVLATLNCNQNESSSRRDTNHERSPLNESTPLHQLSTSSVHPSTASIHKQVFNEQSFRIRLRGAACTLLFSVATWLLAAFALDASNYQNSANSVLLSETIDYFSENAVDPGVDLSLLFSCLFAIFSSSMGIFLLYQHVVSRTDASQHWKRFLQCKKQLYDVNHENVQLTANVKSKQPKNTGTASVTEELTLETVAPVTTGEENSLTLPSSSLRERGRGVAVEDPVIISAVSNKCPSQSQIASSSACHHPDNALDHQRRNKATVKLTNLQMYQQQQEPSLTEHSFDDSLVNMHTVPIILQQHQLKPDNSAMLNRHQKIRKNLEAKRKRRQKLTVLREFAHDPLTSNDEEKGNKKTKGVSLGSASWGLPEFDQHKVDEKMLENLAINEYKKADELEQLNNIGVQDRPLRPLLICSPQKKKEKFIPRPRPHRKRLNRNPNLMSSYKLKSPESPNEFESGDDPPSPLVPQTNGDWASPSNRVEGVELPHGRGEDRHLLAEHHKTHSYLTASSILTNPFHIPARNSGLSPSQASPPKSGDDDLFGQVGVTRSQDVKKCFERIGNETSI